MKLTLDRMLYWHSVIIGPTVVPKEVWEFYESFPKHRGFYEPSPDHLDAVIVAGLTQAFADKNARVLFLAPPALFTLGMDQFKTRAEHMFGTLRKAKQKIPRETLTMLVADYKSAFGRVMTGNKIPAKAPEYWVAYGFSQDEALPDWLKDGMT